MPSKWITKKSVILHCFIRSDYEQCYRNAFSDGNHTNYTITHLQRASNWNRLNETVTHEYFRRWTWCWNSELKLNDTIDLYESFNTRLHSRNKVFFEFIIKLTHILKINRWPHLSYRSTAHSFAYPLASYRLRCKFSIQHQIETPFRCPSSR